MSINQNQSAQINPVELENLLKRSCVSQEERAVVYRELKGRMSEVVNAATAITQPKVARQAIELLMNLAANSESRKAFIWANFDVTELTAIVKLATTPGQLNAASIALLANLTNGSVIRTSQLWETLTKANDAAIVASATTTKPQRTAAMALLANLMTGSEARKAAIWASLEMTGYTNIITAVSTTGSPRTNLMALRLLSTLAEGSTTRTAALSASLGVTGRAGVLAVATTLGQPQVAAKALHLLVVLSLKSLAMQAELWATLGMTGRAAVVAAATNPEQPTVAKNALRFLDRLTLRANGVAAELWATLGAAGHAAVVAAVTNPTQPAMAYEALQLLISLAVNSDLRKTELWAALGDAGRESLVHAATTAGEPEVANNALELLQLLNVNPHINVAIWPLLQPRLAQLWVVAQQPIAFYSTTNFLFEQIRGDAQKIRQVLNALNAAIPAISMRRSIDTLRDWGEAASRQEPHQLALLTGIVQANTTPQKMAVFTAAVMSGINLLQRPLEDREALRDQLLAIPMAEGIDPGPYRQHMRLGFDAACSNTAAVIESQFLPAREKLQLLEIIYSLGEFLSTQTTQEELSKIRLITNISRDFKLQAIGLILNHGQAIEIQFKEILAWLKGEFKKDPHTVFTNPATLGDIGDEAIYALAEQRQQYLTLYQNFRPHMTCDFIQAEIAHINLSVLEKEMPADFGATLIFQLRQFLPIAMIDSDSDSDSDVKDDRQYDRKSESK
ncbi:hypothetical protein [Polaromonas vacuolata]|uniref:hypothetical protein n=1 Tax=Polaromonas vacuolata TaxID=37448 RepID=UPI00145757EB|nr:hypothetical protein [Polaromonas vacuolata]